MKRFLLATGVALTLIGATGCRKNPVDSLSTDERRIYITNRDETVNFNDYTTFRMAADVVVIDEGNNQRQLTAADAAYIEAFANAMESRGFVQANVNASPDLGVQVTRIIRTTTGLITAPVMWGAWGGAGFWGPGFGPGFGWGAPPLWQTTQYQIREGMVSFDIIDLKNAVSNNNLRIVWNALIRGPQLNSPVSAPQQVARLFEQAPYINAN